MTPLRDLLIDLGACADARVWAAGRPADGRSWRACPRGDWLLWIAATVKVDRRLVVLAACDCAELAMPVWRKAYPKDRRPQEAIRVARAWCRGRATLAQVRRADAAASAATLRRCAVLVRKRIPWSVIRDALATSQSKVAS